MEVQWLGLRLAMFNVGINNCHHLTYLVVWPYPSLMQCRVQHAMEKLYLTIL